jgi:hypothetical protein
MCKLLFPRLITLGDVGSSTLTVQEITRLEPCKSAKKAIRYMSPGIGLLVSITVSYPTSSDDQGYFLAKLCRRMMRVTNFSSHRKVRLLKASFMLRKKTTQIGRDCHFVFPATTRYWNRSVRVGVPVNATRDRRLSLS